MYPGPDLNTVFLVACLATAVVMLVVWLVGRRFGWWDL